MDRISGLNQPTPVQLFATPYKQPQPQTAAQPQPRPDQLVLSAVANSTASSALEALKLLNRVNEHPGGLKGPAGEALTPEQALQRLSDGEEVLARLKPLERGARNVSALLFSLEDVQALQAKIA